MKIRLPKRTVLAPVRPNFGVEAEFRRRLLQLVDDMDRAITKAVLKAYEEHPPHASMAADASPAREMHRVMAGLANEWNYAVKKNADEIARRFATGSLHASDTAFKKLLHKAGFSVKFQMSRPMNDAYQAVIGENVGLIKSIASEHLSKVQGDVMRAVQAGRSMKELTEDLKDRYGVTRRRAALIARDQNNKATAIMNRVRQLSLGIREAVWSHTSASVHPRPEHMEFDGQTYDVVEGHDFDDGFGPVLPGQAINCGCTGRSVIPGFDDEEGESAIA